jgi:hypothetical protein
MLEKTHPEELHNFYSSLNIRMIIPRQMRWAGHVTRMGGEVKIKFWLESLRGRGHSDDLGVDGRIILKWILRK